MEILLDNDLFFAAICSSHARHATARAWLDARKPDGWRISLETWLAAMRLLMNPAIMGGSMLDGETAWNVVNMEVKGPHPAKLVLARKPPMASIFRKASGHKQVMDFWLVQLARQEKLKLATFDKPLHTHWPEDTLLVG